VTIRNKDQHVDFTWICLAVKKAGVHCILMYT